MTMKCRLLWYVLALVPLASGTPVQAAESDFACQVVDCLPGPDVSDTSAVCESMMAHLFETLAQGQPYRGCPERGIRVSDIGYDPYSCQGQRYSVRNDVQMCREPNGAGAPFDYAMTARADPYFVDITFPDGFVVRLWYAKS